MSWSFRHKGTPETVEAAAAVHLPQAKNCVAHIPAELKAVEVFEQLVAAAVQHAKDNDADVVEVEGYGSAFNKSEWNKHGGIAANMKISVSKSAEANV